MSILLVPIALTVLGAVAFLAIYLDDARTNRKRIVAARISGAPTEAAPDPVRIFRERKEHNKFLAKVFPLSKDSRERLNQRLQQAGWSIGPGEFVLLRLFTLFTLPLAGIIILRRFGIDAPLLIGATVVLSMIFGWMLPGSLLSRARSKRKEKTEKQLPEALTTLAKSLQAGTGLTQALAYAAQESPAPLGPELDQTLRDIRLGSEDAFESLRKRVDSKDLDVAVTAIMIQRTIGGNLAEILSNVTETIRERARIRSEIMVLTAEQRMSANIIAFFPVIVAIAFIWITPAVGTRLFTTFPGQITLIGGIVLEILGIVIIRRLSHIEV